MATRTEPIGIPLSNTVGGRVVPGPGRGGGRRMPRRGGGVLGGAARRLLALARDELVEPAHLALDALEPVLLQLEGVAVEPLAGTGQRRAERVEPLLEPGPASLEDAQPDRGLGAAE